MNRIFITLSFVLICLQLFSQTLNTELEYVDQEITWPWNWDIISAQDKLITVNENGTLNIKINNVWEILEVNPDEPSIEPRGVEVDDSGTIWITTTEHGLWSYADGEFVNYNSSNSFLPVDNLRSIAIQNNIFWISTDGLGLIRHDFNTSETTHFTEGQYPDLKTDFLLDPYLDASGNVWFRNREYLSKISPDLEWTNEDMRFHISGGNVKDIHIVSETEIWLAMNGGLVLYDGSDYNVVIQSQFDNYIQVFKDSRGDLWLSRTSNFNGDGITVIHNDQEYFFSADENADIPSQVFEFVEYQDTIIAVGTIGNSIAKFNFETVSSVTDEPVGMLSIFPNPATQELTLDIDSSQNPTNWVISALSGKKVMAGNAVPITLDISHLPSGAYILILNTEQGPVAKIVSIVNRN